MPLLLITDNYSLTDEALEADLFSSLPDPRPLSDEELDDLWDDILDARREYEAMAFNL